MSACWSSKTLLRFVDSSARYRTEPSNNSHTVRATVIRTAKISAWLDSFTPQLAGAKMIYCSVDWKDIQIHGDLAYEWGINRQRIFDDFAVRLLLPIHATSPGSLPYIDPVGRAVAGSTKDWRARSWRTLRGNFQRIEKLTTATVRCCWKPCLEDCRADGDTCGAWFRRIARTHAASNQYFRIRRQQRFV